MRTLPCIAAAAVATLTGCAGSPPASYYTLLPAADTVSTAAATPSFGLEILPIGVPLQVDQPQIMLRTADDALSPMYSQRWASPLGEEIQTALSHAMTAMLGAPDVSSLGASPGVPVWRVQVDVQRFDMLLGGPALIDATWRIRESGRPPGKTQPGAARSGATRSSATRPDVVLLCRSVVRQPAPGADLPALVQAQQRAVQALARTISSAIESGARAPSSSEVVQLHGCTRTAEAG